MIPDYTDINRGLKRKVNKAKRDGTEKVTVDVAFLQNVSVALDSLIQARKMAEKNRPMWGVRPPEEDV